MIVDVILVIVVLAVLALIGYLVFRTPDRKDERQDHADKIILTIQVTDDVMTILPAHLRADINEYAVSYLHGKR